MFTALKKVFSWLEKSLSHAQYHDMERYLGQAQSPSDLESRMRRWELAQSRNGRFYLS